MNNRNRKYPIIHLCPGELGSLHPEIYLCPGEPSSHYPEILLCSGEPGSLHPEILYCPGEADPLLPIILYCPGEAGALLPIILYCPGEADPLYLIILYCSGEPSSLHPENFLCSGEPGSPEMPAPGRAREAERDGGRRSPEPLCLPRLGCSAPGEKHPWLAASATWSGSCRSGKAHHTEYRLLRALENKCQSHRPRILTVLSFLFMRGTGFPPSDNLSLSGGTEFPPSDNSILLRGTEFPPSRNSSLFKGTGFPCDARSGRAGKAERDGGRRSPEPLCLPRLGCSASREKHPRLAASATWSGSCKSGKAHHTECRLLRTPGNKCQSHRPMILTVLSFLFTKKL